MIVLRIDPEAPSTVIGELRLIALRYPGDVPLTVLAGDRQLTLGDAWRYDGQPACLAALGEFGTVEQPDS